MPVFSHRLSQGGLLGRRGRRLRVNGGGHALAKAGQPRPRKRTVGQLKSIVSGVPLSDLASAHQMAERPDERLYCKSISVQQRAWFDHAVDTPRNSSPILTSPLGVGSSDLRVWTPATAMIVLGVKSGARPVDDWLCGPRRRSRQRYYRRLVPPIIMPIRGCRIELYSTTRARARLLTIEREGAGTARISSQ